MERLDKFLTSQGVCTRSEAGRLCRRGRILVDGVAVTDPSRKIDPNTAVVTADGAVLTYKKRLYVMLHKPTGVVSASRDTRAKTVLDLLPDSLQRRGLFPAGRLDKDTTGLLIITDDGDFAHKMLAPKSHVPKTYHVQLDQPVSADLPAQFARGITLSDGTRCAPAVLRQIDESEYPRWSITITEGKYHQIKRMFGTFGYNVVALHRVSIGKLSLDPALPRGACRELTPAEQALALEMP